MKTLHLFGDSFTEGHKLDLTFPPFKEWKKYRGGEFPPCWGELLSQKLGLKMSNHAVGGMSNSEIFQTICRHAHEFEKDDIVIINWTYPSRFRWATWSDDIKNYRWVRLSGNPHDGTVISENTRNDIALQKILSPCIEEIYENENLIFEYSKSKGFKVFFWSADVDIINDLPKERLVNKKYILGNLINEIPSPLPYNKHIQIHRSSMKRTIFDVFYEHGGVTVGEETNWEIKDTHLGESGHRVQFELFYNYIMSNNSI